MTMSRLFPILLCCPLFPGTALAENVVSPTEADTDADMLEELVVTGTRTPKLLKDTPVQTRLITARDIEQSDATDIRDLLQQEMPGVEFSYAMNQQVHLNFNGQGGQSVLFLVDGERLAGETMDDVDFSRLNMSNVERIEIVRGASSALYGSNAGGGVINIITKDAANPWRVTADARVGKHKEQRYNLGLTLSGKRVRNVLTGSRYSIDNYDVHSAENPVTRVISTIYGSEIWNVNDKFTYSPADNLRLTARGGFYYRQVTRTEDSPERYRDFNGGLRAEWDITLADRLEVSYAFDQYDKSDFYRISKLDIRSYSNVQNSVRALYHHTFGRGDILSAGTDLMRDYISNTKLTDPRHSQLSFDAFAQYDWIIDPRWEIIGAVRYDYFSDSHDSHVTPKLSVRYKPRFDLNIRLGYGMGFRAPTLKEKYYEFDMAGIWIVKGNSDLKPETSHNINLSADYTRGPLNYTLSMYYNDIRNRISTGLPYALTGDPDQLYLNYVNLSHYSVFGGEASVQGKWNNGISAKATYAYVKENVSRDKEGNISNNQYIPARQHSLTARVGYEYRFSKQYLLSASLSGRVLSGVDNTEYKDYYDIDAGTVTVHYPPYTLWKLSMSQKFGRFVSLDLTVDNLFNYRPKYYYLNCPLTDGTAFSVGVSLDLY